MLLTRAPVAGGRVAAPPLPLDLHVLGLSLAFILSQDQTLRCLFFYLLFSFCSFDSPGARLAAATPGVVLSRVSRSICLFPAAAPGGRSSAASFQCTIPGPQGRLAKLTTIPRFSKLPPHFFSGPGVVSRLRLQRYYRSPLFSKFSGDFFSSFFTPSAQDPVSHADAPETFFTKNCFKTCPRLNPPQIPLKIVNII